MANQGTRYRIPGERRRVAVLQGELEAERERRVAAEQSAAHRRFEWLKQLSTAVTMATALAALIFTGLSLQQTRAQNDINEQGQITSRYTAAVDQLGSQSEDVRLGGIFALRRILRDSPTDQSTIVAVLSAFIRNHPPGLAPDMPVSPRAKLPTDIESALGVLTSRSWPAGQRPDLHGVSFRGLDLHDVSLTGLDLTGADFVGADLNDASLDNSDLKTATFSTAGQQPADLTGTVLTGANLPYAILTNVNLHYADLSNAGLVGAVLGGANLTDADLPNARLDDADLTGAVLTNAKLRGTNMCAGTKPIDSSRGYRCDAS